MNYDDDDDFDDDGEDEEDDNNDMNDDASHCQVTDARCQYQGIPGTASPNTKRRRVAGT
ncbi:hypothetical protein DPMN_181022 [Dreissena polymorpha]|uniref:Uncharacterized protein n=1 Tax=Dreissena polymorpha TaxID=45954 RepID=A0A9D4DCQ9_DREPO|nr:hypothetical protein DPMN_181022 [Dreissena polymorpha]